MEAPPLLTKRDEDPGCCDELCMLAADLAQRLYRTSDTASLRQLLQRYETPLISLRSVTYDTQQSLKQAFHLPKKAAWTLFATWEHFGIACMRSQTPMAREVQAYYRQAEEGWRTNAAAEQETGFSTRQLTQMAELLEARAKSPAPPPASAEVALQELLARRIANIQSIVTLRQSLGLSVGSSLNLALEAMAGEVAGIPVKTLADRDMHYASHFWAQKRREGWRTTYPGGNKVRHNILQTAS